MCAVINVYPIPSIAQLSEKIPQKVRISILGCASAILMATAKHPIEQYIKVSIFKWKDIVASSFLLFRAYISGDFCQQIKTEEDPSGKDGSKKLHVLLHDSLQARNEGIFLKPSSAHSKIIGVEREGVHVVLYKVPLILTLGRNSFYFTPLELINSKTYIALFAALTVENLACRPRRWFSVNALDTINNLKGHVTSRFLFSFSHSMTFLSARQWHVVQLIYRSNSLPLWISNSKFR